MKKQIVVLVSGRGTNLQSIIDYCKTSKLAQINEVISSNNSAYALTRARSANIQCTILPPRQRDHFLMVRLNELNPDLVVLAGYMKILPCEVINRYRYKIINIHPSLLPAFKGLNAQKQAIEFGARVSGCTVHFVDEGIDSGPIILQHPVKIDKDETEETLSEKILPFEHKLLVEAIDLFCNESIRIEGRRVILNNGWMDESKSISRSSNQVHLN